MSAESKDPKSTRLPFEPGQSRKKPSKVDGADQTVKEKKQSKPQGDRLAAKSVKTQSQPSAPAQSTVNKESQAEQRSASIPEVVSKRMARRMALFSGLPTGLGVLTFFVSYLVVTQGWLKLPNVAVLLVSMGFFGLGVLGLSYGVLSTCWDEDRVGTLLGTEEFGTNFGRITEAWKSSRDKT